MDNNIKTQNFDSSNIIMFIVKRWKVIFGITAIGAVLAGAASFLITPEFKSQVIIYPTETSSIAKDVSSDLTGNSFLDFGDEVEVEKYLQILNSTQLKHMVIDKFDLYKHYDIERDLKNSKSKIEAKYDSKISISRTKYLAILIEVLDESPEKAAEIASEIPTLLDSLINKINFERSSVALALLEKRYKEQEIEINHIQDTLQFVRMKGVHSYDQQVERYTEAFAKALAAGNMNGAREIEKHLTVLAKYGGIFTQYNQERVYSIDHLSFLKKKINELKMEIDNKVPKVYVIETAMVSDKKVKPVRSLIVLTSAFSTFITILLVLMIKDWSKVSK